jgi:hypothetical protein
VRRRRPAGPAPHQRHVGAGLPADARMPRARARVERGSEGRSDYWAASHVALGISARASVAAPGHRLAGIAGDRKKSRGRIGSCGRGRRPHGDSEGPRPPAGRCHRREWPRRTWTDLASSISAAGRPAESCAGISIDRDKDDRRAAMRAVQCARTCAVHVLMFSSPDRLPQKQTASSSRTQIRFR